MTTTDSSCGIKLLLRSAIVVLLGITSTASLAQKPQKVGYVLEMVGAWNLSDSPQPLSLGQQLAGGALLSNPSPADGDHVVIANLRGEIIKTVRCKSVTCKECRDTANCEDRIKPLPVATDQTGILSAIFQAVMDLFSSKPDRYSIHRARGTNFTLNADAVLLLEGSNVDVRSVLRDQEKGDYTLQFYFLSKSNMAANGWVSEDIPLRWDPAMPVNVDVAGIAPGLYRLSVTHNEDISTAWVLLSEQSDYPRLSVEYEKAVAETGHWGEAVSPQTKRSYLRAYLEYLTSHPQTTNE